MKILKFDCYDMKNKKKILYLNFEIKGLEI